MENKKIAVCSNNPDHKDGFITTAHVAQDWIVDKNGNFIAVSADATDIIASPDKSNTWTCKTCGADAIWVDETIKPVMSIEIQRQISAIIKDNCESCSHINNHTCSCEMIKACQEEKRQEIEKILKENNISNSNIFFATFLTKNIKLIAPSDTINLSAEDIGNILYECFEFFKKIAEICNITLEYDADNIDFDATASIGEHVLNLLESSKFIIRKD